MAPVQYLQYLGSLFKEGVSYLAYSFCFQQKPIIDDIIL